MTPFRHLPTMRDPPVSFAEIEQIRRLDWLMRQASRCSNDCGDTTSRRLHASHPDPEQVLSAIPGLSCEMRRLNPPTLHKRFESRDHHAGKVTIRPCGYISQAWYTSRMVVDRKR